MSMTRAMRSDQRGFGIISILITLAIIMLLTYEMMKPKPSAPLISKGTQKQLEAQGVALPTNGGITRPQQIEDAVKTQLGQANDLHEKNIECSTSENRESNGCSPQAQAAPAAAPSP